MLNFQGTVYIKNGFHLKITTWGGSILNVNPGSVLIINQHLVHSSIPTNSTVKLGIIKWRGKSPPVGGPGPLGQPKYPCPLK